MKIYDIQKKVTPQMKITMTLLMLLGLFSPNSLAQNYTQLNLPESAIDRLGKGWVFEMKYSPDGTRLVVCSSGIWLYDTTIDQEVVLITGHTDEITSVVSNPDGRTLVSASEDGTVLLWKITD